MNAQSLSYSKTAGHQKSEAIARVVLGHDFGRVSLIPSVPEPTPKAPVSI